MNEVIVYPESPSVGMFSDCNNLTIARMYTDIISENMFYRCSNLSRIYRSDVIRQFGDYSLVGTTCLHNIRFGNDTNIGMSAFSESGIEYAHFGNNCTIGMAAFSGCKNIMKLNRFDTIASIGQYSFDQSNVNIYINPKTGKYGYYIVAAPRDSIMMYTDHLGSTAECDSRPTGKHFYLESTTDNMVVVYLNGIEK